MARRPERAPGAPGAPPSASRAERKRRPPRMRAEVWAGVLVLVAAVLAFASPALAIDRNFAASAQLDYLVVPTENSPGYVPVPQGAGSYSVAGGTANTLGGFTMEASLKLAADLSDHVSANVKVCYGCHGFEADMIYFDLRAADELNFRVGRFSPSFGAFNLRHDVGNQKLSDKPLPYDMGRMLRYYLWNDGVVPSPFPENGLEIDGTHWFGADVQLDYAAYTVTGFRNHTELGYLPDLNYLDSRFPFYYVQTPSPTGGGRVAITIKPTQLSEVSLGASGMFGTYDDANSLWYEIVGADLGIRVNRTILRMEYLVRRTDIDVSSGGPTYKYAIPPSDGDFFVKHGAYAELDQPVVTNLDFIARLDGLLRLGNVAAYNPELTSKSGVLRETLGLAYSLERNVRLKASVEGYEWTDKDAIGHKEDVAIHLGMTGTF